MVNFKSFSQDPNKKITYNPSLKEVSMGVNVWNLVVDGQAERDSLLAIDKERLKDKDSTNALQKAEISSLNGTIIRKDKALDDKDKEYDKLNNFYISSEKENKNILNPKTVVAGFICLLLGMVIAK